MAGPFMTSPTRRLLLWVAPLLLFTVLLLFTSALMSDSWHWPTDLRIPHRFVTQARPPPYFPPRGQLKQWVAQEEGRYKKTVADRWDLVKQLGPTQDDVVSFPFKKPYLLWDFFIPAWRCPHSTQRVGALSDGGKWVCGMELLAPRAHFHKWGLGGEDTHEPGSPTMYTLRSLMAMNGHDFIDVFKIDIEGAEFDALSSLLTSLEHVGEDSVPFGQMQIEIHAWVPHQEFRFFMGWWESLEKFGLRPFWFEPNLVYVNAMDARPELAEYAFINVKGNHALISD